MQKYIGVKLVEAEPCEWGTWMTMKNNEPYGRFSDDEQGYIVVYPNGYESWCPKDVFEKAYFPMGQLPNGTENDNKITQEMVDLFTGTPTVTNISDKSTLVKVTPLTGFEQYEVSSCVDPANYDPIIGEGVATRKIKDRIWGHLGFVLQWAKYGLRK